MTEPSPELYPLDLLRCSGCTLVQLQQIVSPARLFSEYAYFSSYSDTMLEHAQDLADKIVDREGLVSSSLVVEIASNDGYLLQYVKSRGVGVLGIEPARNIAEAAQNERGIPTLCRFFGMDLAEELVQASNAADVLIGNNVLAHVPALNDFASGVRRLLKPGGVAVFEVPYLKDLLDRVEFDTIYHEHQCYFSLTALTNMFAAQGLQVVDLEHLPIHGGSIRVWVAHPGKRLVHPRVSSLLDAEQAWGVATSEPYARFADAASELKQRLLMLLDCKKSEAKRGVAAYGAAAKGVTLLSYCGIDGRYLDFVVDRSPHKQGRRFPVAGLPILSPAALMERQPDYTLLLTWNFADEIVRQQSMYCAAGGRFIVPVPVPSVIGE